VTRTSSATSTRATGTTSTTRAPVGSGTATWSGNPYSGVDLWANNYYRSEVLNLAVPSLTGAMATAAARVAEVPSFMWL
jgi:cellulose 1,4-beta-cellobiosidase